MPFENREFNRNAEASYSSPDAAEDSVRFQLHATEPKAPYQTRGVEHWAMTVWKTVLRIGSMIWLVFGSLTIALIGTTLLASCDRPVIFESQSWKIYRNNRYDFQFPYPNDWEPAPSPNNQDGQAFVDPENPEVQIRGWASQISLSLGAEPPLDADELALNREAGIERSELNFITEQGLEGQLRVQIGPEISVMSLTLVQDDITYHWLGRSPSQDFAAYYAFFNYVASQYRIFYEPEIYEPEPF